MTDDDDRFDLPDGRTVGVRDHGRAGDVPVLWCHGGPGSRLEPANVVPAATAAGFRIIGIDRPGYGHSTPVPGRTIASWVPDGLAVADHLGVDRFVAVGVSTGGAYSLALAAMAPERVLGVVACCALTDMRWPEGKAMQQGAQIQDIWAAKDRDHAIAIAEDAFGADGSKMLGGAADDGPGLAPADMALLGDAEWMTAMATAFPAMFAQGVIGYADDRIADGPGWGTFDVGAVRCPVEVVHGGQDTIVPVAQAHHTASLVAGANVTIEPELGHLSITPAVVPALERLRARFS